MDVKTTSCAYWVGTILKRFKTFKENLYPDATCIKKIFIHTKEKIYKKIFLKNVLNNKLTNKFVTFPNEHYYIVIYLH